MKITQFAFSFGAHVASVLFVLLQLALPATSGAMPVFARKYDLSCAACHSAYPRLNQFDGPFRDNNMKLPNWRESKSVSTGFVNR
jgi:hypothetical protein